MRCVDAASYDISRHGFDRVEFFCSDTARTCSKVRHRGHQRARVRVYRSGFAQRRLIASMGREMAAFPTATRTATSQL